MALCACPLVGKPDASDWPPPEPSVQDYFSSGIPGIFFALAQFSAPKSLEQA